MVVRANSINLFVLCLGIWEETIMHIRLHVSNFIHPKVQIPGAIFAIALAIALWTALIVVGVDIFG